MDGCVPCCVLRVTCSRHASHSCVRGIQSPDAAQLARNTQHQHCPGSRGGPRFVPVRAAAPAPPYALTTPSFEFPALASLAGRAPMGGEREVALACLVVARLAAGASALTSEVRGARAAAAKVWL